ncbi:MAG: citrate/2-methylcitrate synthase [Halomonas sp.]|nr:citrate/2-methylcitrate synthase [Halomonas sp.]MDZ7852664.1 citrate/2-methylcitrate synthase [Halomonas sp.]
MIQNESLYIHSPELELSTAENLLQLVRPNRDYTKLEAETLDLALVLHAEHGGGNNSSFSVHVVSSAGTDTYSAIATACGSLKGPKHGGASGRVATMMEEVMNGVGKWDDEEEIGTYLTRIARKQAGDGTGLIYGMGHAVYTLSDPRAVLLKEKARELAAAKGYTEQLALYERVEELTPGVLREVRGRTEPISANVDFYSGLVYEMLNIPRDLYVPIFAVSRVAGWSAHLIEEIVSGGRIMRPAYKNILGRRDYVPTASGGSRPPTLRSAGSGRAARGRRRAGAGRRYRQASAFSASACLITSSAMRPGNRLVVVELHLEAAGAGGDRAQVDGVAQKLRLRNLGLDDDEAAADLLLPLYTATPRGEVGEHVAEVLLLDEDLEVHQRARAGWAWPSARPPSVRPSQPS